MRSAMPVGTRVNPKNYENPILLPFYHMKDPGSHLPEPYVPGSQVMRGKTTSSATGLLPSETLLPSLTLLPRG